MKLIFALPCHSWLLLAAFLLAKPLCADQTISGKLTVTGELDVLSGHLSLGASSFFDEQNNETLAEGLTIHHSEVPQTWVDQSFVPGRSTVIYQVGQELADFYWRASSPDGLGGFTALDLMKLSSEQLLLQPSLSALGTENTLPNQTLSGGNASILTLGLADIRYLSQSGGSISGNLVVTGSATLSSLNVDGSAVLTEASTIYIKARQDNTIVGGGGSFAPDWSGGIAIGNPAWAGVNAVTIGNYAGRMSGTLVSGDRSVALGYTARAPGVSSIAVGDITWASGADSVVIGTGANTNRSASTAIGLGTAASQPNQVILGVFNQVSPSLDGLFPTNDLFVIGNGTADDARSNALVVKRNGDMEVKGTKLTVNGSDVLTTTSGGYLPAFNDNSIRIGGGANVVDWSAGIAIGGVASAGENAVAIGNNAGHWTISGPQSVAIGYVARAPAAYAIALGEITWGGGEESIVIGRHAEAHRSKSVAIGRGAYANQANQVVLGAFNVPSPASETLHPTHDLFILGNGTGPETENRSNALIVKRNGNMEVKGTSLTVNGTEVLTQASLEAAVEDINLTNGNYISRDAAIGMYYGTGTTAAAHSIALGEASEATGSQSSSAVGYYTVSNQAGTHSLGNHLVANLPGQIVLGNYNAYGSTLAGSSTPAQNDPVFIVGNGSADNARTNALVIRRNGSIELAGTALTFNESALLTQSAADSLYLAQADASAYLTVTAAAANYLTQAVADTRYLTLTDASSGYLTTTAAAALYQPLPEPGTSFLTSADLVAIQAGIDDQIDAAELATALAGIDLSGNYLSKDPQIGLAYGSDSQAMAGTSAIGTGAVANQTGAHALGDHVIANRPGQVVVGSYNDHGPTAEGSSTADAEDNVFVVGVGSPGASGQPDERKNALVVKRDGNVHLSGVLRVPPAGNLLMGEFDDGPEPEGTAE